MGPFKSREPFYIIALVILVGSIFWLLREQGTANEFANAQFLVESKRVIDQDLANVDKQLEWIKKGKDTAFTVRATTLRNQIETIKKELDGATSDDQQISLKLKLTALQKEIDLLNVEYENYQESIVDNMIEVIDAKDKSYNELFAKFLKTKTELSELKNDTERLNDTKIVSSIHYTVSAYTRKNSETKKARYTTYLKLNLKINADSVLAFQTVNVQVIDPLGINIARPGEQIDFRNPNTYPEYKFTPKEGATFRAGVYRVRLFQDPYKFEIVHTVSLNSKW